MDNIIKAYVSQVKAILPVLGKKEKAFIKKLRDDLFDYCEDNNVNTINELYRDFGTPQEIAFEYITLIEPEAMLKQINTAKFIKALVICLLILATIITSIIGITIHSEYKTFKEQYWITTEEIIN